MSSLRCALLSLLLLLLLLLSSPLAASSQLSAASPLVLPFLALPRASSVDWPSVVSDVRSLLTGPPSAGEAEAHRGPAFIFLAWHSSASFSTSDGRGGTDGAGIRSTHTAPCTAALPFPHPPLILTPPSPFPSLRFLPERRWPPNGSIGPALHLLEQLQRRHPNVSLADLVALSAVVAIQAMRGPHIPFQPGRADLPPHPLPLSTPSRIPTGNSSLPTLLRTFHSLGLTPQEMVALIGAHSVGRCHIDRSGYEGQWSRRPATFSADLFRTMKGERWREREWRGPMQWTNEDGRLMMLPSDLALMEGEETRRWVLRYADDEPLFFSHFAAAFAKLIELGVRRQSGAEGRG